MTTCLVCGDEYDENEGGCDCLSQTNIAASPTSPLDDMVVLQPNPDETLSHNDGDWWCETCHGWVAPEHVTYDETHDIREGGCGKGVV